MLPLLFLTAFMVSGMQPMQQSEGKLKVFQNGRQLQLRFPALLNRSAVKVTDMSGQVIKGALVDEQSTSYALEMDRYSKGMHLVTLENRQQLFRARIMLQ